MSEPSRILHPGLRQKIMSADAAAALIEHGDHVGMSGFTGAGYPKAVPQALAKHIEQANQGGNKFRISHYTWIRLNDQLPNATKPEARITRTARSSETWKCPKPVRNSRNASTPYVSGSRRATTASAGGSP